MRIGEHLCNSRGVTTPFVIDANLDIEARWAGGSLPAAIATRVSYYASLVAALAPEGADVELWAPAPIDASRLVAFDGWRPPTMRAGTPPRADLRWADPDAKPANDRRLAHEVARSIGAGLPGARVIATVDEIDALADLGAWVAKAPWTTAGRDRCHGNGPPTTEQRTRLTRLIERFGAIVVEPWLERTRDVGVCATIDANGNYTAYLPHLLTTDARGTFLGIDMRCELHEPALDRAVRAAARALRAAHYAGPFSVDAFAHTTGFHPLCEINARYTFGWIARALHLRLGIRRLGFSTPPPGARILVAPGGDGITAWVD